MKGKSRKFGSFHILGLIFIYFVQDVLCEFCELYVARYIETRSMNIVDFVHKMELKELSTTD